MSREQHIARTFVELADTLVEDFDVIGFLQQLTVRCQELLDVVDAAVFLSHTGPHLYSPAPCDPGPALQRVLDVACVQGPALDAYRTAQPVDARSPEDAAGRWPEFAPHMQHAGYSLATALPMRLREDTIGSLLLLHAAARPMGAEDLALGQALADAATIGLLHSRTIREQGTVNEQLHTALQSRIVIEQAKGLLAARRNVSLNRAFDMMRRYARSHRILLGDVARDVIENGSSLRRPPVPRAEPGRPGKHRESPGHPENGENGKNQKNRKSSEDQNPPESRKIPEGRKTPESQEDRENPADPADAG